MGTSRNIQNVGEYFWKLNPKKSKVETLRDFGYCLHRGEPCGVEKRGWVSSFFSINIASVSTGDCSRRPDQLSISFDSREAWILIGNFAAIHRHSLPSSVSSYYQALIYFFFLKNKIYFVMSAGICISIELDLLSKATTSVPSGVHDELKY
jgi:hypothetical protein